MAATSHGSAARPKASPAGQPIQQFGGARLLEELVPRDARRDGVDPDAVLDGFDCTAAGQRHHAGLGRGVVRLRVLCAPAQDAGVVDDHAAVRGVAEVPQRRAGGAQHRCQRDVEDAVPFLVGHVDDRRLPAEAGVVDQDVDAAHLAPWSSDQRVDLGGGRHVAHHALDPAQPECGQLVARSRPAAVRGGRRRRRRPPRRAPAGRSPNRCRCRRPRSRRPPCLPEVRVRQSLSALRTSTLIPSNLSRQAEHPLGDDVALDLVGPAVDGVGAGEQEQPLPLVEVAVASTSARPCRARPSPARPGRDASWPTTTSTRCPGRGCSTSMVASA